MKKKIMMIAVVALLAGLLVVPVIAKGPDGQSGKSNVGHLYLYEKDADWVIIEGGAWGKMKYNMSGLTFDFVFNGHNLPIGVDYTLIYFQESVPPGEQPWPFSVICLGSGTSNTEGNVHIAGSVDPGVSFDSKIWLVLTGDLECVGVDGTMTAWTQAAYLFENDLIVFTYLP